MIGSGSTIANLQARLGLNTTDYAKGVINASGLNRVFGESFTTFVSNPLLGSIGILKDVGRGMITHSQQVLATAETYERMSQTTGLSEQLLISLTKQLELAGFSAERTRQAGLGLNKFLADFNAQGAMSTDVLSRMGISFDGMRGQDQIFREIIQSLSEIEDPATKAGFAARFFGEEAGPELINAIGGGNDALDEMIDRYTKLGFVVDRRANSSLAALNTTVGVGQQAFEGLQNNLVSEFLLGVSDNAALSNDSIVRLAETLNNDLGPAANAIGELLIPLLQGLGFIAEKANTTSDALAELFGYYQHRSEQTQDYINKTGLYSQPTEAQLRNRERGQQYLQIEEEMGL